MAEPLQIEQFEGLAIALVMARKGADSTALTAKFAIAPSTSPRVVAGDCGTRLIGVGPGAWLALAQDPPAGWVDFVTETLAEVAVVADQSSAYVTLRLSGQGAHDLLQAGVNIDLHPDSFPVGAAAVTAIAHIGVTLWKVDDAPTFELAVSRSFAGAFGEWIAATGGA